MAGGGGGGGGERVRCVVVAGWISKIYIFVAFAAAESEDLGVIADEGDAF